VGDDDGDHGAERQLAEQGASLSALLVEAVPGWVGREVERIVDAWEASGPTRDGGVDRVAIRREAQEAGRRAAADVAVALRPLVAADVDEQSATPLEIVRRAVAYPTGVLARAGVPPVVRDSFHEDRFPHDLYGLTPATLGAVDTSLVGPARAWGAAKAMAHKARHRPRPMS
jgi:hypothetical protein